MSKKLHIQPGALCGEIVIPPSKSHTHRGLIFALLSKGKSTLLNPLISKDIATCIKAIESFGAKVDSSEGKITIQGYGRDLSPPQDVIDAGNSGIVLRFIAAIAVHAPETTIITGDASIRHHRIVTPLLNGLNALGAYALSAACNERAPLIIKGPLIGGSATIPGPDSQPFSALLISSFLAQKKSILTYSSTSELPWIQMTLGWLDRLKLPYQKEGSTFTIDPVESIPSFSTNIPSDWSSAAFPIVGALITHSQITLLGLEQNCGQGDAKILEILQKMGACLSFKNNKLTLFPSELKGITFSINPMIDALPIFAVLGCFCSSPLTMTEIESAKYKESNRVETITKELQKMGAHIEVFEDSMTIYPSILHGNHKLESHFDQRIALALAIAALGAKGCSTINDFEWSEKTYPSFVKDMQHLRSNMQLIEMGLLT